MNYAEEQLEYARENELQSIKLRNKELVLENEKLHRDVEFREKCFYELNDGYIELGKENKELKEEIKSKEELLQKYYKDAKERLISNKGTEMYENDLKEENQKLRELVKLLL